MLRRRSQPDESNSRISFVRASKFINGVKNKELRTIVTLDQNGQKSMAEKFFYL